MSDWEQEELEEKIGQAAVLLRKLLVFPEDCELRSTCENWVDEHKSYMPMPESYHVSELDGIDSNLKF